MVVQDTSGGRVGVEGPIKGVMGRCAQATNPSAGTRGRRAHNGWPVPGARADQDGPRPDEAPVRPRRPARWPARAVQGASSGPGRAVRWPAGSPR